MVCMAIPVAMGHGPGVWFIFLDALLGQLKSIKIHVLACSYTCMELLEDEAMQQHFPLIFGFINYYVQHHVHCHVPHPLSDVKNVNTVGSAISTKLAIIYHITM